MKSKHILLLSILLSQAAPVWAMEEAEGNNNRLARPVLQQRRVENQDMDFDALQNAIQEISANIPDANPNARPMRVIVLGPTGSGKTTLIHGLAGQNLIPQEGDEGRQLRPQQQLPGFNVGHGGIVGTTIPRSCVLDNVEYWDNPGFGDPRGAGKDLVNAFAINKLFRNASIKVLLTIPENYFITDRGTPFLNLLNEMVDLLPDRVQREQCISMVITKQRDIQRPHATLERLLREQAILTPDAQNFLDYLVKNPNRISTFGYPNHQANYNLNRGGILGCIQTADYVENPNVALRVGPASQLLINQLANNFNASITNYVRETIAPGIINFCQTAIDNHHGMVGVLRNHFANLEQDLRNLQQIPNNNPLAFVDGLARFGDNTPVRRLVGNIDFLKRIRANITHQVGQWGHPLLQSTQQVHGLAQPPQIVGSSLQGILVGTSDMGNADRSIYALNTLFIDTAASRSTLGS